MQLRQSSGEGVGAALERDLAGAGAPHLAPVWKPWASPEPGGTRQLDGTCCGGHAASGLGCLQGSAHPDHTHLPGWILVSLLSLIAPMSVQECFVSAAKNRLMRVPAMG